MGTRPNPYICALHAILRLQSFLLNPKSVLSLLQSLALVRLQSSLHTGELQQPSYEPTRVAMLYDCGASGVPQRRVHTPHTEDQPLQDRIPVDGVPDKLCHPPYALLINGRFFSAAFTKDGNRNVESIICLALAGSQTPLR